MSKNKKLFLIYVYINKSAGITDYVGLQQAILA
jgi:hypothetical protein